MRRFIFLCLLTFIFAGCDMEENEGTQTLTAEQIEEIKNTYTLKQVIINVVPNDGKPVFFDVKLINGYWAENFTDTLTFSTYDGQHNFYTKNLSETIILFNNREFTLEPTDEFIVYATSINKDILSASIH